MRFPSVTEFDAPVDGLGMTARDLFGDRAAFELAANLIEISNVWDDLIDREPISGSAVNTAFYVALIDLPANPFYQRHAAVLIPLMQAAIVDFLCANHWENAQDAHGLELAHVLRYGIARVVGHIVLLARGMEFSMRVLPAFYKVLCGERFEEYRAEIMNRGVNNG